MSKTSGLINKVPTNYEKSAFTDILTALFKQVDGISENKITAKHNALASAPSGTVVAYAVGDFTPDSNPTLRANTGAASFNYARLGWLCTVPGTPGTQQEVRVMVGDVSVIAGGASLTASITVSGDVALNNTANYFDGPSQSVVAGTGVYFASGTVSLQDTAGAANFDVKLWDGTTVIDSVRTQTYGASGFMSATLSGFIASPAGAIRISVRDPSSTSGAIKANLTGNSKDSNLTVLKIG